MEDAGYAAEHQRLELLAQQLRGEEARLLLLAEDHTPRRVLSSAALGSDEGALVVAAPSATFTAERARALRLLEQLRAEETTLRILEPSHNGIELPRHEEASQHAWVTTVGPVPTLIPVQDPIGPGSLSARMPGHVRGDLVQQGSSLTPRSNRTGTFARPNAPPQAHRGLATHHHLPTLGHSSAPVPPRGHAPGRVPEAPDTLIRLRECIKQMLAEPARYGSAHQRLDEEYRYVMQLYADEATRIQPHELVVAGSRRQQTHALPSHTLNIHENWFDAQLRRATVAKSDVGGLDPAGGDPNVSTLAREIAQLRKLLSSAEAARDQYKALLHRATHDLQTREETIAELEKHVSSTETTELELKRQNNNLTQELYKLKAELVAADEAKKKDGSLKRRLETQAERRLVDAKAEISGLYQQLKVLTHRYQILEREIGSTQEDRDNYESRFLNATKEADDAYDAINQRDSSIGSLQRDLVALMLRYELLEHAVRDVTMLMGRDSFASLLMHPAEQDAEDFLTQELDAAVSAQVFGGTFSARRKSVRTPQAMQASASAGGATMRPTSSDHASRSTEFGGTKSFEAVRKAADVLLKVARGPLAVSEATAAAAEQRRPARYMLPLVRHRVALRRRCCRRTPAHGPHSAPGRLRARVCCGAARRRRARCAEHGKLSPRVAGLGQRRCRCWWWCRKRRGCRSTS
jgi:predicted  nucleic acid-binding Zn-ribbon protein